MFQLLGNSVTYCFPGISVLKVIDLQKTHPSSSIPNVGWKQKRPSWRNLQVFYVCLLWPRKFRETLWWLLLLLDRKGMSGWVVMWRKGCMLGY